MSQARATARSVLGKLVPWKLALLDLVLQLSRARRRARLVLLQRRALLQLRLAQVLLPHVPVCCLLPVRRALPKRELTFGKVARVCRCTTIGLVPVACSMTRRQLVPAACVGVRVAVLPRMVPPTRVPSSAALVAG